MNTIKSTVQVAIFITSIVGVAAQRYGRGVGSVSLAIQAILLYVSPSISFQPLNNVLIILSGYHSLVL